VILFGTKGIVKGVVPSTYSSDRLTPLAGRIRDGAHRRVATPPPFLASAAAHYAARARPWRGI